jgi:superfamily I DNA/RNA helicase
MPEILSVEDFYKKIELLFSDYDPNLPPRLTLSSIHKSKGLEFPTVYLLGRNLWQPSPFASQPWMLAQENNLTYVAITRAKVNLIEVTVKEE